MIDLLSHNDESENVMSSIKMLRGFNNTFFFVERDASTEVE